MTKSSARNGGALTKSHNFVKNSVNFDKNLEFSFSFSCLVKIIVGLKLH